MRIVIPLVVLALMVVGVAYARIHFRATKRRMELEYERHLEQIRRDEADWIDNKLRGDQ